MAGKTRQRAGLRDRIPAGKAPDSNNAGDAVPEIGSSPANKEGR